MAGAFDPQQHAKALLEGFTGRQWLVDEVVKWRDDPNAPRYLLITGEPGIGKSAFAAHLWLDQRIVHVCHFCIGSMDSTLLPANFVESLRDQLAAGLPGFQQALRHLSEVPPQVNIEAQVRTGDVEDSDVAGVRIETLYIGAMPPDGAFDRYIRRPLCRLAEKNSLPPLVILVDALDEAIAKPEPHILSLLLGADDLPNVVRFVLTSRDVPQVRKSLRGKPHQVICADDPRNQEDVQEFLRKQWEDEQLRAQVARWGSDWDGERFVSFLAARSE